LRRHRVVLVTSLLVGLVELGGVDAITLQLVEESVGQVLADLSLTGQDPGEFDVRHAQDGLAGIDESVVVVVGVDHVVLAVWGSCGEADEEVGGVLAGGAVGVSDGAYLSPVLVSAVVDLDVAVVLEGVVGTGTFALLEVSGEHPDLVPVAQVLLEIEGGLSGHSGAAPEGGTLGQAGQPAGRKNQQLQHDDDRKWYY